MARFTLADLDVFENVCELFDEHKKEGEYAYFGLSQDLDGTSPTLLTIMVTDGNLLYKTNEVLYPQDASFVNRYEATLGLAQDILDNVFRKLRS